MLFMKEMRGKVVSECTLKESAAINQILGRRVSNNCSFWNNSWTYVMHIFYKVIKVCKTVYCSSTWIFHSLQLNLFPGFETIISGLVDFDWISLWLERISKDFCCFQLAECLMQIFSLFCPLFFIALLLKGN